MSLDLSTLSGQEIAVAIRSGKTDVASVVAHLANRLLPAEQFGALLASSAIPPEFFGAVMLAQSALQAKKPAASKLAPVRISITEKSKRLVVVQPPKDASADGYTMTNPPASWLWILDHAAEIREACAKVSAMSAEDVAKAAAEKLAKAAAK